MILCNNEFIIHNERSNAMLQSAAESAAKQATSIVVHADTESRLKTLLQVRQMLSSRPASITSTQPLQDDVNAASTPAPPPTLAALQHVYDQLLLLGLSTQHIQDALCATLPHGASLPVALDWVCWHVPPRDLPMRFRGERAVADAAVRNAAVAKGRPVLEQQDTYDATVLVFLPAPLASAAARQAKEHAQQQQRAQRQAQQDARKQAEESEAAQAKQWILSQYMQRDSDSEDDASSSDSIHDWQLYGGAEEQAAGRAAQARAKLDPEARRRLVAQEMAEARAEAAAAKGAGDAARQRAAGQSIGRLKQEMKTLGALVRSISYSCMESCRHQ